MDFSRCVEVTGTQFFWFSQRMNISTQEKTTILHDSAVHLHLLKRHPQYACNMLGTRTIVWCIEMSRILAEKQANIKPRHRWRLVTQAVALAAPAALHQLLASS